MVNRIVPAVLIVLLVIIHAQLWVGRGSLPNVAALQRKGCKWLHGLAARRWANRCHSCSGVLARGWAAAWPGKALVWLLTTNARRGAALG